MEFSLQHESNGKVTEDITHAEDVIVEGITTSQSTNTRARPPAEYRYFFNVMFGSHLFLATEIVWSDYSYSLYLTTDSFLFFFFFSLSFSILLSWSELSLLFTSSLHVVIVNTAWLINQGYSFCNLVCCPFGCNAAHSCRWIYDAGSLSYAHAMFRFLWSCSDHSLLWPEPKTMKLLVWICM